ncbi:hypothetical protein OGM63_05720 [Plectonema radiosum NIES-515]|uniref:DUF2778 domain-containing protein n=1 Tax=Plectonema radiosum NIES-515 TaxID=2986073 RepID=A0ABT3AV69_9CYAN|nr:hypothetical protein [Plectonema radiosum]MCV3213029.1 hypothetical protein [Plectonema radiosum NIES-515]
MKPLLLYHQHLQESSQLIEGRLLLIDCETRTIKNTYIATSGLPGNQSYDCLAQRGTGPIPPISLTGLDSYTVTTAPLDMPNVRGVEGDFYKIDPHEVTINGAERGDFGVHRDANVPGSSGCVVLRTTVGWQAFRKDMHILASSEIKQVPLLVSYSR